MSKLQRILLAAGLIMGMGVWYYCYAVFLPDWKAQEAVFGLTWTHHSDLYPRWVGTRELLLQHRDPYTPEVTRDIQIGYYGRPVGEGYRADPQGFAYPLYVVWFLGPSIWSNFSSVSVAFAILLLLAVATSVPLWCKGLGFRCDYPLLLLALIFTLGSWPVVQGVAVQQLTLLVAFLLAAALAALARGYLRLSGVLLALATIKPQLSLPLIAWLVVWSCADWRKRRSLVGSCGLALAVLIISAEALLPHWISHWRASWGTYLQGTNSKLSLQILLGDGWGLAATGVIVLAVAAACIMRAKGEAASPAIASCHALVAAATLVVFPTWYLDGYNQVLLLPAVLWIILRANGSGRRRPAASMLQWGALACVFWPSLVASALATAALLFGRATLSHEAILRLPAYDFCLIPLLLVAALMIALPASSTSREPQLARHFEAASK